MNTILVIAFVVCCFFLQECQCVEELKKEMECTYDTTGFTLVSTKRVELGHIQFVKMTDVWEKIDQIQCDDNDEKTSDIFQQVIIQMMSRIRHSSANITCQCIHPLIEEERRKKEMTSMKESSSSSSSWFNFF